MDYLKLIQHPLNLDSTFHFRCRQCGDCCRNREDILLSPYDLSRIARHLSVNPKHVVDRFCHFYIGDSSRLPVVLLKSIGNDKRCPFLLNNRCSIHASKPTVCALFPLGRFANVSEGNGRTQFFLQPVSCGAKDEAHTVREWLSSFDLLESETWFQAWQRAITALSPLMGKLQTTLSEDILDMVYSILFSVMYLNYQNDQDFLPQFNTNMRKVIELLTKVDSLNTP